MEKIKEATLTPNENNALWTIDYEDPISGRIVTCSDIEIVPITDNAGHIYYSPEYNAYPRTYIGKYNTPDDNELALLVAEATNNM